MPGCYAWRIRPAADCPDAAVRPHRVVQRPQDRPCGGVRGPLPLASLGWLHCSCPRNGREGRRHRSALFPRWALLRDLEAAGYAAERAFRQYDAADPENRLVAAELETRWNRALLRVAEVEAKIAEHDAATMPCPERMAPSLAALADDLSAVWSAPTTDVRLKKRIIRTVIQGVIADIDADAGQSYSSLTGWRHPHGAAPAPRAPWPAQRHRARHHRRRPAAGPRCR